MTLGFRVRKGFPGGSTMTREPPFTAPPGYRWIFFMSFRHYITGEIVRRKNGRPFAILVRC